MQNKKTVAYSIAAAATVTLSVLRILLAPSFAKSSGGALSVVLFALAPLVAAALLFVSPRQPAATPASGRSLLSFGGIFAGILMLFSAVWDFFRWKTQGEWPFPAPSSATPLSYVFFILLCVFALLGGAFFVMQGIAWTRGRPLGGWLPLLALAPLFWSWIRICRYEMSYCSSLYVFRHWYDLAALLFQAIFFLLLARFVTGCRSPRFLCGVSLTTGVLLTVACITRVAMALFGEQAAFADSALLAAPDLGVALMAFGVAKTYTPSAQEEAAMQEDPSMPEEPVAQTADIPVPELHGEEDDVSDVDDKHETFLLPLDSPELVPDTDDSVPDNTPVKPLELEDMILRMMQNPEEEEK